MTLCNCPTCMHLRSFTTDPDELEGIVPTIYRWADNRGINRREAQLSIIMSPNVYTIYKAILARKEQ